MLYSSSQIDLDEQFDLDMALTMPEISTTESEMNKQKESDAESKAEQLIEEMPTVIAGNGLRCSVCMEGFRVGVAGKEIPCGHVFHSNCIVQWVSLHNSCPLCRSAVAVSGRR